MIFSILLFIGDRSEIPLATFKQPNQFVQLNDSTRLYCEAFVGKSKHPTQQSHSHQTVRWYQIFNNNLLQEVDGQVEVVERLV